jgi:hypothetical protein
MLGSPGIDSEESRPPAYVDWRDGTTNRVVVPTRQVGNRFLGSLKGLQIRALAGRYDNPIHTRFLAPIDCLKIKIPALETIGIFKIRSISAGIFKQSIVAIGTEQE